MLSLLFVVAGINHFVSPGDYLRIMPDYLPWPSMLVHVSGYFEVLGGIGVVVPRLRRDGGLSTLLIAVFPPNSDMVMYADKFAAIPL